jgi:flagellin-like protein
MKVRRRGLSSVLTSVLMCAVVLTIGVSVWGFTNSATTMMRTDYYDEVIDSVNKIKERFNIENLGVNITSAPSLQVWVDNYGDIDVNITKIKVSGGGNVSYYYPPDNDDDAAPNGVVLVSGELSRFDVVQDDVLMSKGLSISVMVESSRGNKAYEETQIP